MNNPLEILRTLDRHLTRPVELTLFGRSALALGYPEPKPEYGATLDVDGIIPITGPEPDTDFWLAQQATNAELKKRGLYITHLFSELDIILQPDWIQRRTFLETLSFKNLKVFRPATIDLVLTKMARGDDQDLSDIRFLLQREPLSKEGLRTAFARARVPEVSEIRELFDKAQHRVLTLVAE